ncbi:MAG TPA: RNA polymerase sigma factor [Vicinamibacterales bacterium]|nr:RNA polymerase sigma factor [Vicinamibacterales bacterium]
MTPAGPNDEDAADVRRVLAGDPAAFAGIVNRWQTRLINLAWRFCHDRTLAEDMAQEAFVRAFRALQSFRGESAFSTWLTAIAINSYRTALRDREPAAVSLDFVKASGPGPDVLAGLQERERDAAVRQSVFKLPPRYRDALVLFYFEEMNLAETARVLGIAEGTLKARLHRGRELLRRRLG